MILLIDAGNSAVKWGLLAPDGAFLPGGRTLHRAEPDVQARMRDAWRSLPRLTRAVGCAVAGVDVVGSIDSVVRELTGSAVEWWHSQARFAGVGHALTNGYRVPAQLGADRWHAALGACVRLPGSSAVVVNAGTATTVDCLQATAGETRFVGGCIAPGVRLMLESLAHGTAGLPLAAGEPVDFPDSTDDAIITGVLDAQAGLVERVWRRWAARVGMAPRLLIAGGHAELLAARLPTEVGAVIEHNLVLRGLALRASLR